MIISIFTGFVAGVIHVISGADHLAAMAPGAMDKPRSALKDGLAWGIGHSIGVLILAAITILIKDLADLERLSNWAEFAVGLVLLIVGALAVRTSLGLNIHSHNHKHANGNSHRHLHLHLYGQKKHSRHSHAITSIGLLHGMAGASHLLAIMPTLTLPTIIAIFYMTAYLLGSVFAMSAFVLTLSFATLRTGKNLFKSIVGFTGGLSIITGVFWLHKTYPLIL